MNSTLSYAHSGHRPDHDQPPERRAPIDRGSLTMSQIKKATEFAALHVKGAPIVLYNAWDAGSAKAIADAGARAIATSSSAVAAAQGYADGEQLPLALAE